MVRRFTRIQTSEGGAMREECTGAFVLYGDYANLNSRHDELLEALRSVIEACSNLGYNGDGQEELYIEVEKAEKIINKALGETK